MKLISALSAVSAVALAAAAGCAATSDLDAPAGKHLSPDDVRAPAAGKSDAAHRLGGDLQPDQTLRVAITAGPEGPGRWQTVRIHARKGQQIDAWVRSVG